ncbi:MAG: VOC family protein [Desulfomonilaceae bacterium]|nr:VOC family protein [Desulfomonilaceae bacterium]
MLNVERIDHVCIAVRDLDQAMKTWGLFFGKSRPDLVYRHDPEAIEVARYFVGEVGFELMASTKEGSDVDRFIAKRGEGPMLISFKVPDAEAAMKELIEAGFELLDNRWRQWRDSRYFFMNPKYMNGVLVELID